MANSIKSTGDGLALQITEPARASNLAEERPNGEARRLAPVVVYAVDGALVVVDREELDIEDRAELIASAARDTRSLYRGAHAEVTTAGHGYKVQLPCATDARLQEGDRAPTHTADRLLVITDGSRGANRLGRDLVTIREEQG
jgi:hypothetical protein